MGRKPRIHRPVAFYHVMLRGNNGQDIFFSDQDRCRMCLLLQEGVERFEHRIHGFCLMSNHVHLVMQAGTKPLSQSMHHLASSYARYFNYRHQRLGHLFQDRFKAILVDAEHYLQELVRYVHLNPVRANLCLRPEEYKWSGHKAYVKLTEIPWLSQDWILNKFHPYEDSARQFYAEYINRGIGEKSELDFDLGTYQGRFLGDDTFIEEVVHEMGKKAKYSTKVTVSEVVNVTAQMLQVDVSAIQSREKRSEIANARALTAIIVNELPHLTIKELAKFLDKSPNALSRLASQLGQKAKLDKDLQRLIEQTRAQLSAIAGTSVDK